MQFLIKLINLVETILWVPSDSTHWMAAVAHIE